VKNYIACNCELDQFRECSLVSRGWPIVRCKQRIMNHGCAGPAAMKARKALLT